MPITSTQISGLVGGNQVAFANQAAYSQQLGSLYGTGPQISPPSLQNPFPSYGGGGYPYADAGAGGGAIGSAAMAMPALATGVSLGGALLGGRAGFLDPFTGSYRAFAAGSGAGWNAGFGAMTNIGRTFATGGIRAGMGALGGGAAAAGAMALPYMAVGAGIHGAAESVYEGAQTYRDAGRLGQQLGPSFGVQGSLPGGKLPRHQIRQIATVLEEFADENIIASVTTATRLAQKFSQMGMMSGVYDANSFKQKFQALAKQVDTVAKVMGTSLEEAAPVLQNMQRMGLWRPEDVMGTLMTAKMVGPQAAQQMMGAMQTGAMQSHSMGGAMAAGAALGREAFMTVRGGLRAGTFSNESVMEYTGGVGGEEGQRMMAETMTTAMQRAGQHPLYQAMMAGLGEMQEGKFTGRVDERQLKQFMGGGMSAQDLMRQGRERTRGRKAQLSFDYRRGQLSQEMVAKGGIGGLAQGLEAIFKERGDWDELGEEARGRLIQMVTGSDQRTAEMLRRVIEDHRKIQKEHERTAMDATADYYRQRERRANNSYQGFKDALAHRSEAMWRPMRELGASLGQAYDETRDSLVRAIWEGPRGLTMSGAQAQTLALRGQASGEAPGYTRGAGQLGGFDLGMTGLLNYGTANRGTLIANTIATRNLTKMGDGWGGIAGAALQGAAVGGVAGFAAGGVLAAPGAVAGAVIGGAGAYLRGGAGTRDEQGLIALTREGGDVMGISQTDLEEAQRRAIKRAQSSDAYALGFQGEGDSKNLAVVKNALRQLTTTAEGRNALRDAKARGGDHMGNQAAAVMDLLKRQPGVGDAINALSKSKGGNRDQGEADVLRVVEGEVGLPKGMSVDWAKGADGFQWSDLTGDAFKEQEEKVIQASIGGLRSGASDLINTGAAGALGGSRVDRLAGVSNEELRSVVANPEYGVDLYKYLEGGEGTSEAQQRLFAASKENATLGKIMEVYDRRSPAERKAAAEKMRGTASLISFKAGENISKERAAAAKEALGGIGQVQMGAAEKGEMTEILKSIASGDQNAQQAAMGRLIDLGQKMKESGQEKEFARAGSFAQIGLAGAELRDAAGGKKTFEATRKGIEKRLGLDIFKEEEQRIQKMMEGGLSSEELRELQGIGEEKLRQLSVSGGGKTAGGGPMGELAAQLTSYTAANTKFVHTVGAFVSGASTGDLKQIGENLKKLLDQEKNNSAGPAKPGEVR